MKFSKIVVSATLVLLSVSAVAQNERPHNWFIGAGGGLNVGFDGQSYVNRASSHEGAGTAVDIYAGKFLGDLIGVRVGYQGLTTSDSFVSYGKYPFNYLHGDVLFRLREAVLPYAHIGFTSITTGSVAGGVGIMFPLRLSNRVSIVPDIKATALNGNDYAAGASKLGVNVSGTLGIRVDLGNVNYIKKKVQVDDQDIVPIIIEEDIQDASKDNKPIIEETKPVSDGVEKKQIEKDGDDRYDAKEDKKGDDVIPVTPPVPAKDVVLFAFNSSELSAESKEILDKWVSYLAENPGIKVRAEGHACNIGAEAVNEVISLQRASAVRDYLVSKGVDASRLSTAEFGDTRPVASNDDPATRYLNRRAQVVVVE